MVRTERYEQRNPLPNKVTVAHDERSPRPSTHSSPHRRERPVRCDELWGAVAAKLGHADFRMAECQHVHRSPSYVAERTNGVAELWRDEKSNLAALV
jgi:hypothetical protein